MKLTDILKLGFDPAPWEEKGYLLPKFDVQSVREKTYREPTWVHFGAGNIFRAFPAALLQKVLDEGGYDRGVIVVGGHDTQAIERGYREYDNLSLLVELKSDGSVEKRVIASVTESLRADRQFAEDTVRLASIFENASLQMVSFTITEKGYASPEDDLARGLAPERPMGKVAALLLKRFLAGAHPITLQSMDNCARNGDVVRAAICAYASAWCKAGLAPDAFLIYLQDEKRVACPWSMIDKITPRPDEEVQKMLHADGFLDAEIATTEKGTLASAFVNAEEVGYLVMEDSYANGRPPLELGGAIYAGRDTVDLVEKMKVGACLNPLHTAMSLFGCLLGYTRISEEMKDPDIVDFITKLAHREALPIIKNPGVISPEEFLETVLTKRFPNPFLPDAPQRIATDTSQKLPIRFGETIKAYLERGMDVKALTLIPLTFAVYARYLRGIDDRGVPFTPSPDPKLEELSTIVASFEVRVGPQDMSPLRRLFSRNDVFGVDLYEVGLGEKIEGMVAELYSGPGAVRETLRKYVQQM
ncbi:MAG: mannitol dehydrogenase family protein [Oscillospiraceae bacterium]|nr:mannitol dehydrogenase family protein [Oscillospiraceae bacterium]